MPRAPVSEFYHQSEPKQRSHKRPLFALAPRPSTLNAMEDEAEVLDWGNEDDEQQISSEAYRTHLPKGAFDTFEEAEDAVSLGSHEDDQQDVFVLDGDGLQDVSKRRVSTPKPLSTATSRDHHREHSTSSHRQRSPQQSPRRSHSFSKITHALPPKPVVSHVPFVEPFNASIIEATAMSWRTDRDKKTNGSAGKPVSSGDSGEPLPPDWEIRQPRSGAHGVYFYNVRTHESTWTRPVFVKASSTKDKEKSRSQVPESRRKAHDHPSVTNSPEHITTSRSARPDIEHQVPAKDLSYEDRHYRPGGDAITDSGIREERPQRAFTPPPSPKIKPVERPKDAERPRPRRSSPSLPKTSTSSQAPPKDHQREPSQAQVSSKDRRWGPPRDTTHLEDMPRRRPTPPRPDVEMPLSASPIYEDRNFRNDGELSSSAPRHRSSPPHIRDTQSSSYFAQAPQASVPPTPTDSASRQSSRFDRSANPLQQSSRSRNHDVYIPTDALPQKGERELELTSTQISAEHGTKRKRPADESIHTRGDSRGVAAPTEVLVPTIPPERPASGSSSSHTEQSRQRKRLPLPPQSARFREMSRKDQTPPTVTVPVGPRDSTTGAQPQRPANTINSNLPSGPRHQPQPPVRDANHPDFAHGPRIPPSGPSAALSNRARAPRAPNDPAFTPNDAMAVDPPTAPASNRSQPLRMSDLPIQANSGMYADRELLQGEQNNDMLPKGPRAMAAASRPSTSPTATFTSHRSVTSQELSANRPRVRSPPPHLVGKDGWGVARGPTDQQQQNGSNQGSSWRPDAPRDRADTLSSRHGPVHMARSQREPPSNQRPPDFPNPPTGPLPKLSGTNSVPIGNRKAQFAASNSQQPGLPPATKRQDAVSGNIVEPPRIRSMRIETQVGEPYDKPPRSSRIVSPVNSYRSGPSDIDTEYQRRSLPDPNSISPTFERRPLSPVDGYQSSMVSSRSRRESYYAEPDQTRFSQQEQPAMQRAWNAREHSPAPLGRSNTGSYNSESEYHHRATPPPLSRESSLTSPHWEPSSYIPTVRPQAMADLPDNPRRSRFGDPIRHDAADPQPRYQQDSAEHQRTRHSATLEGRLSQTYNERYDDDRKNRPHPQPLSPTTRRDRSHFVDVHVTNRADSRDSFDERRVGGWDHDMHRHGHDQNHRRHPSPVADNLHPDRSHAFDGPPSFPEVSQHSAKPVRIRRPQRRDDDGPLDPPTDVIRMDRRDSNHDVEFASSAHLVERPRSSRRGASLLDRLSLDAGPSDLPSSSLRDRVQIPAKRDRDEMMRSYSGGGDSADAEDIGGVADSSRRPKRRTGRPKGRRGRNGGS